MGRMRQFFPRIPIVGEQQRPVVLRVQFSYRVQPFPQALATRFITVLRSLGFEVVVIKPLGLFRVIHRLFRL